MLRASSADYTANRDDAQAMANQIMKKYHKDGHTWVRVWLEPMQLESGRKFYAIRSNIVFKVPQYI
jgi:hypothetical protein